MSAPSILIVEDEKIVAEDLRDTVLRLGYRITGLVGTSAEAYENAKATKPNLILMDIKLQGEEDGVAAASRIRNEFRIPIVYVTAFSNEVILARAKQTEPYGYIIKPFEQRDIQTAIEIALHKYATEESLRKKMEEDLKEAVDRLALALETGHMGVWDVDLLRRTVTRSGGRDELFGFAGDSIEGGYGSIIDHIYPADREAVIAKVREAVDARLDFNIEYRVGWHDNSLHWLASRGRAFYDAEGNPTRLIGVNVDVTERKHAEQRLRTALEEKELLLKEVYHRVKNNLQVIDSLLKIESEYVKDERSLAIFRESQNRIKSMALVHQQLYQTNDSNRLPFKGYIRNLAENLYRSYGVSRSRIELHLDIADILLGVDTAIPCGLIVNELISNALKYAFPEGKRGEIYVLMTEKHDDLYLLEVGDNGIGLEADFDFQKLDTLGLRLVDMLVKELHGSLKLHRNGGTMYTISFQETTLRDNN